ncbi:MAG: hypothetical protein AAGE52_20280 [Myxococcota bacterium]
MENWQYWLVFLTLAAVGPLFGKLLDDRDQRRRAAEKRESTRRT